MNPTPYPAAGGSYVRESDGSLRAASLPALLTPPELALDQAEAPPADADPTPATPEE